MGHNDIFSPCHPLGDADPHKKIVCSLLQHVFGCGAHIADVQEHTMSVFEHWLYHQRRDTRAVRTATSRMMRPDFIETLWACFATYKGAAARRGWAGPQLSVYVQRQDTRALCSVPQTDVAVSLLCRLHRKIGEEGSDYQQKALRRVLRNVVRQWAATAAHSSSPDTSDAFSGLCVAFEQLLAHVAMPEDNASARFPLLDASEVQTLQEDIVRCKSLWQANCALAQHIPTTSNSDDNDAWPPPVRHISSGETFYKECLQQHERQPGLATALRFVVCQQEVLCRSANIPGLQCWIDCRFPTAERQRSVLCARVCRAINTYILPRSADTQGTTPVYATSFVCVRPPRLSHAQTVLNQALGQMCTDVWAAQARVLLQSTRRRLIRLMGWILEDTQTQTEEGFALAVSSTVQLQAWLEAHVTDRYNGSTFEHYAVAVKYSLNPLLFFLAHWPKCDSMGGVRELTFGFEGRLWPLRPVGPHHRYCIDDTVDRHSASDLPVPPSLLAFAERHGIIDPVQALVKGVWKLRDTQLSDETQKPLSVTTCKALLWRICFVLKNLCPERDRAVCTCLVDVDTTQLYDVLAELHMHYLDPASNPLRYRPRRPINMPKVASAQKLLAATNMLLRVTNGTIFPCRPRPLRWALVLELVCSRRREAGGSCGQSEADDLQNIYGWQEARDATQMGRLVTKDHLTEDEVAAVRARLAQEDTAAGRMSTLKARLLFETALATGLRRGEISRLRAEDIIDPVTGRAPELSVVRQKGGSTRMFVATGDMVDACRRYVHHTGRRDTFLFAARQLTSRTHTHASAASIGRCLTQLMVRSGVERQRAHPHALRKTVVVRLWRAGNSVEMISKFLCHGRVNTTYKHYLDMTYPELVHSMEQRNQVVPTGAAPPPNAFSAMSLDDLLVLENLMQSGQN